MNINVYGMSSTSLGLNLRSLHRTCFKILTFTAATTEENTGKYSLFFSGKPSQRLNCCKQISYKSE